MRVRVTTVDGAQVGDMEDRDGRLYGTTPLTARLAAGYMARLRSAGRTYDSTTAARFWDGWSNGYWQAQAR